MTVSASKNAPLSGRCRPPGDKSISHRALIFGALAEGDTKVSGLLESDDVLRTAAALRALGAEIERCGDDWLIRGGRWQSPARTLYAGNAGTSVRLLMGAVAGQNISARFDGDASLRKRPMERILAPLRDMGLEASADDGKLPVHLAGSSLSGIRYRLPTPSAQIKSAVLLAGLGATGETIIEEPLLCRDHTEKMLGAFGVTLEIAPLKGTQGGREITLRGRQTLTAARVTVPADPSSAAFPVVAGLIVPGSDLTVEGVLMNPQRTGLFDTLLEMGADMTFENRRLEGGEEIADLHVRHSQLKAVTVPANRAPAMIDEYPVLAVAAAFAAGTTRMNGLSELRVKESDRLAAVEAGLRANHIPCQAGEDWLEVTGTPEGADNYGGGLVATHLDHRIAMSFLVLGMAITRPVRIDSGAMIATSFPSFFDLMTHLGAEIGQS